MRGVLRLGSSALVVLLIMFLGSLVLWAGIPLGWLWAASQIDVAIGSLGAAVVLALLGVVASIMALVSLLGWLSNKHRQLLVARGREDTGHLVLEAVIATSATITLVGFGAWFLVFAGTSPIPLELSP